MDVEEAQQKNVFVYYETDQLPLRPPRRSSPGNHRLVQSVQDLRRKTGQRDWIW